MKKWIYATSLLILSNSLIYSDIDISGSLRNDAFVVKYNEGFRFSDSLETRLVIQKKTEDWNFYADGRLYLYYGEITEVKEDYEAKLMRGFVRYFSPIGDFTLGKTYINMGISGIFNPFEMDKALILSDLSYTKEGLLALEYEIPLGDLSGAKAFLGYDETLNNYTTGLSLFSNVFKFDFGIVYFRKGYYRKHPQEDLNTTMEKDHKKAMNAAGVYFKGDLGLGLLGGYSYHFRDDLGRNFHEFNFGIDYSFFDGHLILTGICYYSQGGKEKDEGYQSSVDSYFYGKYYIYGNITYIFDEFISADISCFANLKDESMVIIPSIKWIIVNGITLTIQGAYLTGKSGDEFSKDTLGEYSILTRLEAKF